MIDVLVVEDDRDLNGITSAYLRAEGYAVACAFNGREGLEEFRRQSPKLVISDVMMPEMDGFELAQKIRQENSQTPIVFVTARDDKPSKLLGYKIGVDDYLVKPFDMDELVLKVGAIMRRINISKKKELIVGNLTLNEEERSATVDGEELSLTVREFDILYRLLSYPKKAFTRSHLMEEFWDYDSSATSRTVDVYMAKIREKTAGCNGFEIVTIHGLGYKAVLK